MQSLLRHSKIQTTLDLYTQGDSDETLSAQGQFLVATRQRPNPESLSVTGQTPSPQWIAKIDALKEAFEGPEPYDGKPSRPVLRGLAPSNGGWLLGKAMFRH
jgi:hypothetical protein